MFPELVYIVAGYVTAEKRVLRVDGTHEFAFVEELRWEAIAYDVLCWLCYM